MRAPVTWEAEDLLNLRQVSVLLRRRLEAVKESIEKNGTIEHVTIPQAVNGLWTPDEVREIFWNVPQGTATRTYAWSDEEMLRPKQIAALHNPPITPRTFSFYARRADLRREQGLPTTGLCPSSDRIVFKHPLWAPETIRDYLLSRPGPGYHVSGDERRGYRGGRKPGVRPKRLQTV